MTGTESSPSEPIRIVGLGKAIWRQMRHAWVPTLLMGGALFAVAALQTYTRNSAHFQNRAIQLIMKDMGHNLWFLDKSANLLDAIAGMPELPTFPEERIQRLVGDRRIASTYWGNLLQSRHPVDGTEVLLTGYAPIDDHQVTEEKAHLLDPLPPGSAALGHTLARRWGLEPGDRAEWNGRSYQIQAVHPPSGTMDDMRLWLPLGDAQEWLGKPGEVNVILGFLCMQGRSLQAGLERMDGFMAESHEDLQVVPLMNLLNARALARLTTSNYLRYLRLALMAVTVLLVATIGWLEVDERRSELAVLRALGAGQGYVLALFWAKLLVLGVVAVAAGFGVGSAAAVRWLTPFMVTHTRPVAFLWGDFPGLLVQVLALAAVASLVPLVRLARMDPTRILSEE